MWIHGRQALKVQYLGLLTQSKLNFNPTLPSRLKKGAEPSETPPTNSAHVFYYNIVTLLCLPEYQYCYSNVPLLSRSPALGIKTSVVPYRAR